MEELDEDDFGDLYTDMVLQARSAINSIPALIQLPQDEENSESSEGNERISRGGCCGDNAEEEEEEEELVAVALEEQQYWNGNEFVSENESEDDLNIVLNDDEEDCNGNKVINGSKIGFQFGGNGGGFGNEDEVEIEVEGEGNNGMENDGGRHCGGGDVGFELGRRGRGGCSGGGYSAWYKHKRNQSSAFLSNLKRDVAAGVASYSSTFVRGNWEDNCCTLRFGQNPLGAQSGHSFSLPRSRTIVDVNIDALEWKPWRHPGADITDFFNFGLDEDSWRCYCNSLDRYRKQAIKGNRAYKPWRHSMQDEVLWEAATENTTLYKQTGAVFPSHEISCREELLEMPKGKAIQVEDRIGERQPSVDVKQPAERDSSVIIQIPVQDMEEELLSSGEVAFDRGSSHVDEAFDGGKSGDIGSNDGDMLCFSSGSEDELPILEGPTEEKVISIPERRSKHTSTCACYPVCTGSDNCGCVQVSDADEHHHEELAVGNSDGTAEADRSSDDPKKYSSTVKSITVSTIKESRSSHVEESQCGTSFSSSPSHDSESRHGAYAEPDKFYDHSERASPKSESVLHESVTYDCHSSKDSRSNSIKMKSGDYENFARSRSPIQRNVKSHQRKSSRKSKFKSQLDYEYWCDSKKLHDLYHSKIAHCDQRDRHHGLDFIAREEFSYYEGSGYSFSHRGKNYSRNSHRRGHRVSGYDLDYSRTVNAKCRFPEQRIPRFSDDMREKDLDRYEWEDSVQGMESLDFDGPREFISEQSQFLDSRNNTQRKWKSEELNFKRRMKNDNFISECNYSHYLTRENCRSIQYNMKDIDPMQHSYDKESLFGRGEIKSPVRSKRRYDGTLSGCKTIWHQNYEYEKSRCTRGRLSFWSNKEPRTVGRTRGPGASLSRIDIYERHSGQGIHNCVARYSGSSKFGNCAGVFDNHENMESPDKQDDFARRRQCQQFEVLEWREDECSSWYPDYNFRAEGLYPFNKNSRCKRSNSKHGSGCERKLIDPSEPEQYRYNISSEGNSGSKFVESSNIIRRHDVHQTLPRSWDSSDKPMVVWDRKSSRCSGAGSLRCYGRYEHLDLNDDSDQRTFKDLNDSHLQKIVAADNAKTDTFLADANWCNKFPDSKGNDSPDIEEGQIVANDFNEKPMERISSYKNRTNIIGIKNFSDENPRILEIIAKMEKRRERFKEPISSKIVLEKNDKPFADKVAESVETKQVQRPARKRKWMGS